MIIKILRKKFFLKFNLKTIIFSLNKSRVPDSAAVNTCESNPSKLASFACLAVPFFLIPATAS